jgi:hypothetical protein
VKRSWKTIQTWIEKDGFPASIMGKVWTSSKHLIDEWMDGGPEQETIIKLFESFHFWINIWAIFLLL